MSVSKSNVSGSDNDSIAQHITAVILLWEDFCICRGRWRTRVASLDRGVRPQTPGRSLTSVPRFKNARHGNVIFEKGLDADLRIVHHEKMSNRRLTCTEDESNERRTQPLLEDSTNQENTPSHQQSLHHIEMEQMLPETK